MFDVSYSTESEITLIADPKVLSIPIHENQECFVNLLKQSDILIGPSPEIPDNKNYTYVRKTVYEKLKQANSLLPKGIHFCLYEGYRSLELQKMIFEKRYTIVKDKHPDWTSDQLFEDTITLVSPVTNKDGSKNIPPHSTGAAIDVYLVDDEGKALEMGMHPQDWVDNPTISLTNSPIICPEARKIRQLMGEVLTKVGFVNYPTEYWHWSYGDRYWAFIKKQPAAMYGSVKAIECK